MNNVLPEAQYPFPAVVSESLDLLRELNPFTLDCVFNKIRTHKPETPVERAELVARGIQLIAYDENAGHENKPLNRALLYLEAGVDESDPEVVDEIARMRMPGLPTSDGGTQTPIIVGGRFIRGQKYTESGARQVIENSHDQARATLALARLLLDNTPIK
jgi:hypothetical protein